MNYFDWYRRVKEIHKDRTFFNVHRNLYIWISPLSEVVTPIFILLGARADVVTYVRIFLGFISLFWIALADPSQMVWPILFHMFFYRTVDGIDGDIARAKNCSTMKGRYVDGILDATIDSLLPVAFSYLLYRQDPQVIYLIIGTLCSFIFTLGNLNIDRYTTFRRWIKEEQGVDIGDFRLTRSARVFNDILQDFWYTGMFVTIVNIKVGVLMFLFFEFMRGAFLFIFYMRLVFKNMGGYSDQPKIHAFTE